ncbi:MAG: Spy/CpxP family protein refolding chaperone [Phenylobacterium sp.]
MTRSKLGLAGLAAALTLTSAGAAFAQAPPPGGPPPGAMRMMEMRRPDPEARAQRLRDVLQLTPAQEPALKAYLEAQKPPQPPAPPAARAKPLTTPERLDSQRARMVERLAAFDRRAAATRTFYAQLTPSQKKAFDALPPAGGERREIRIERRMMGPGPGGGPGDPHAGHARPE